MRYRVTFMPGASFWERAWVRRAVTAALSAEGAARCEVEVLFTGDEEIQKLNASFRGKDTPTDVLSFPLLNEGFPGIPEPDGAPAMLGSMAVNLPRCRDQALEYGHSYRRELSYLAVHSVLHLLGYDHESAEDKPVMRKREKEILRLLHLPRASRAYRWFGFPDAVRGFGQAVKSERNVRVHLSAAASVSVLGLYLGIDYISWALIALCFGLVTGLELLNTALESLCDKVNNAPDAQIRRAKDISAGAVMAGCLASIGVAAAVFARPELWQGLHPLRTLLIGLSVAAADALFIFLGGSEEEK